jgi:hypothetical protein
MLKVEGKASEQGKPPQHIGTIWGRGETTHENIVESVDWTDYWAIAAAKEFVD